MKKLNLKKIFCILMVAMSINCSSALAVEPVGEIVNYAAIREEIFIKHVEGFNPKEAEDVLYPGDLILGDLNKVSIKFVPYATLDEQTCEIIYNPPTGISRLVVGLKSLAQQVSIKENLEYKIGLFTRGPGEILSAVDITPRPGFSVTLLMNQKVNFAWNENNKHTTFSIIDANGTKVYEQDIRNLNNISLVPAEIKLKPDFPYTWGYDGEYTKFSFTVLDSQTEAEVMGKLVELDKMKLTDEERVLRKAQCVQMISDLFPDKVNLYWLGSQWLGEIEKSKRYQEEIQDLLYRHKGHLNQEKIKNAEMKKIAKLKSVN